MKKNQTIKRIYEDTEILALEKPAGLSVQGGAHVKTTLTDLVEADCGYRVYPVHRLDKETHGLILFAKNQTIARFYSEQFRSQNIHKEYHALCIGSLPKTNGFINSPIVERGRQKKARTEYTLLRAQNGFSFVRLKPVTGRMHQLRIHLAQCNCPIIGDARYGNFPQNKQLKKDLRIKRLLLSATGLCFATQSGQEIVLHIDVSEHLKTACEILLAV